MYSKFLVALLALSPLAYAANFILMTEDGCQNQDCTNTLWVTQSSVQPPGCTELNNAQQANGGNNVFSNRENFSASVCDIYLNFYWDGSQYNYYKNNGDGKSLGWCEPQDMSGGCDPTGIYGSYTAKGVAWCQNYDQTRNGINPCIQ